jgi:FkbM family methyltransferase
LKQLSQFLREIDRRLRPPHEWKNLVFLLRKHGIDQVFDVGANQGQFALRLRRLGWQGRIVSFEPLSREHALLTRHAAGDADWTVAPRVALGNAAGSAALSLFPDDSSLSSLLPVAGTSALPRKGSTPVGSETVPVERLDALAGTWLDGRKTLLKLDVQGYEAHAVAGAAGILNRIEAIWLEVGILPCYAGEWSYLDMLGALRRKGFHAIYLAPISPRRRLKETVQMDVLAVRNPPATFAAPGLPFDAL